MEIFILKLLVVGIIFFRDVKWCFNASWGLKGLIHVGHIWIQILQLSCKKKKKKIEKNSEVGGWEFQAPTQTFVCFLYMFQK